MDWQKVPPTFRHDFGLRVVPAVPPHSPSSYSGCDGIIRALSRTRGRYTVPVRYPIRIHVRLVDRATSLVSAAERLGTKLQETLSPRQAGFATQLRSRRVLTILLTQGWSPRVFPGKCAIIRVLPGELTGFHRNPTPIQLTPGSERSAAGRIAFLALFSRWLAAISSPTRRSRFRESATGDRKEP